MRALLLVVGAFKLIIPLDVHTTTINMRIYKPFLLSFKGNMLNAFVKVNMANHVTLVAVCYCFVD
jgi:hypothetical protein